MRYIARSVGFEENVEDDFRDVWFAENLDGSGRSISFQRTIHSVDQDEVEMGLDSYCVSTQEGATIYGPVRAVHFDHGVLIFSFDTEDASILGLDETVEIELAVAEAEIDGIRAELRDVLDWGRA